MGHNILHTQEGGDPFGNAIGGEEGGGLEGGAAPTPRAGSPALAVIHGVCVKRERKRKRKVGYGESLKEEERI